jgi:hypothetical protein
LDAAYKLLGNIDEKFVEVVDLWAPTNESDKDKAYISTSCMFLLIIILFCKMLLMWDCSDKCDRCFTVDDSSSHFDTACQNILELYRAIEGKDIEFKEEKTEGETEGGDDDDNQ